MGDVGPWVRMGTSSAQREEQAVDEVYEQIAQREPYSVLFFCSPSYDLARLGERLRRAFPGGVHGCTSSGQIGPAGFQRGGLTAVSFADAAVRVTPHVMSPLANAAAQAASIGALVRDARRSAAAPGAFGFLLVDGLSLSEERVASALHHALGGIPLIGGSAGDDLAFERTHVFAGEFRQDAALLLLCETALPFRTFKVQHFAPTGCRMVITAAEPDRRRVVEINGKPAAEEYARLIGRSADELTAEAFAQHPLMLNLGGDYYVRALQKVNPDGTLSFFCAIEAGLVLNLGRGVDGIEALESAFSANGDPDVVLGCDCILRRIEFEQRGIADRIGDLLVRSRVLGFSTYGEQYGGIHVSQTFTGVSLGGSPR